MTRAFASLESFFPYGALALLVAAPALATRVAAPADDPLVLAALDVPRVVDPKLQAVSIPISFTIQPDDVPALVTVSVEQSGTPVATVYVGTLLGAPTPHAVEWDGLDSNGKALDPGDYVVRVTAVADHTEEATADVSVVRLGITAMEFFAPVALDEWQLVYPMKASAYAFFATPAIHEFYNVKKAGEISDLDQDDGEPRLAPPLHSDLLSPSLNPPLTASTYETARYNYPVCFVRGKTPRVRATMGSTCTLSTGVSGACGYPVAGYEIRAVLSDSIGGAWTAPETALSPGAQVTIDGPALSSLVTRQDRVLRWAWQWRATGGGAWSDIPGEFLSDLRVYTLLSRPVFASGASGTQYSGPWAKVADLVTRWSQELAIAPSNDNELIEVVFKGFFGQNGGVRKAIEGVAYDCPSNGGDGGASHYYDFGSNSTALSRLLNTHAYGKFVNCSDVASCSATMAAMLGVRQIQLMRLGPMTLKAIWGIGSPTYTTNLWGTGHSFSYHHIVSRDLGVSVSDACMCVDEDGNPNATPGLPGYNCDRPWAGASGYMALSASNNVTFFFDPLPKLQ